MRIPGVPTIVEVVVEEEVETAFVRYKFFGGRY